MCLALLSQKAGILWLHSFLPPQAQYPGALEGHLFPCEHSGWPQPAAPFSSTFSASYYMERQWNTSAHSSRLKRVEWRGGFPQPIREIDVSMETKANIKFSRKKHKGLTVRNVPGSVSLAGCHSLLLALMFYLSPTAPPSNFSGHFWFPSCHSSQLKMPHSCSSPTSIILPPGSR